MECTRSSARMVHMVTLLNGVLKRDGGSVSCSWLYIRWLYVEFHFGIRKMTNGCCVENGGGFCKCFGFLDCTSMCVLGVDMCGYWIAYAGLKCIGEKSWLGAVFRVNCVGIAKQTFDWLAGRAYIHHCILYYRRYEVKNRLNYNVWGEQLVKIYFGVIFFQVTGALRGLSRRVYIKSEIKVRGKYFSCNQS